VDLMRRKVRDIAVTYKHLQVETTLGEDNIHIPLRDLIIPQFLQRLNELIKSSDPEVVIELRASDIEKVTYLEEVVDLDEPAYTQLPRAGRTKVCCPSNAACA
jgi:hypothetical protein